MELRDIETTAVWNLYEIGQNYHRRMGIYSDTDKNNEFYNGNQWRGAKLGDVEPVQKNIIKPIVKYKCSVIHDNLYAIVYSSLNFENQAFRKTAEKVCELLNGYAARVWERDKMDFKGRRITKNAAIDDEGIMFVDFNQEKMKPNNEILDKTDVYYGNENDDDIQNQPYILIRKRMPVVNAQEFARDAGVAEEKVRYIVGDNDTSELAGNDAKEEVDDQVTIVYKMYKKNGTVHYTIATKYVTLVEDTDLGISLYPLAHFIWEEKKGSARGEGEVRYLIPNQIEINRTEMRRVLTVKLQAYPTKVADVSKIINPDALDRVGVTIKTHGQAVDDVRKIVGTLTPAQMSPDVVKLQEDLIQMTRDLAGAGDTATGQVNPESASGRAILAVQQASQAPMTEQKESYKNFIEDIARIWLEYIIAYSENGIDLEEEVTDPTTGEETIRLVNVPQSALQQLQATVKIDVTPKSVYDRFAQEQTVENLLLQGFFSAQRIGELKIYHKILPDDAVAPKVMIGEAIEYVEEQQRRIAITDANARMMQQRAQQFLMGDPDEQSSMMADAMMRMQQPVEEEEVPTEEEEAPV